MDIVKVGTLLLNLERLSAIEDQGIVEGDAQVAIHMGSCRIVARGPQAIVVRRVFGSMARDLSPEPDEPAYYSAEPPTTDV